SFAVRLSDPGNRHRCLRLAVHPAKTEHLVQSVRPCFDELVPAFANLSFDQQPVLNVKHHPPFSTRAPGIKNVDKPGAPVHVKAPGTTCPSWSVGASMRRAASSLKGHSPFVRVPGRASVRAATVCASTPGFLAPIPECPRRGQVPTLARALAAFRGPGH